MFWSESVKHELLLKAHACQVLPRDKVQLEIPAAFLVRPDKMLQIIPKFYSKRFNVNFCLDYFLDYRSYWGLYLFVIPGLQILQKGYLHDPLHRSRNEGANAS